MLHQLMLAIDWGWTVVFLWPLLLIVSFGLLLLVVIRRVLFGPMNNKPLRDRKHHSAPNSPDPWSESARRLKIDPPPPPEPPEGGDDREPPDDPDDDPDHPPGGPSLEEPARRPLRPPQ